MLSDPRSIAFICELVQPQLRFSTESLQALYGRLAKEPGLNFQNFNQQNGGAQMSTVFGQSESGETSHTSLAFFPDRLQIRDEWPRIGFDDWLERVHKIVEVSMSELQIPQFSVLQSTMRCLVSVRGQGDSRAFLAALLGAQDYSESAFGREPNLLGFRLAFPANPPVDPAVHNVRVESFGRDPRSLFLEATRVATAPIRKEDLSPLTNGLRAGYEFMTQTVCEHLNEISDDGVE